MKFSDQQAFGRRIPLLGPNTSKPGNAHCPGGAAVSWTAQFYHWPILWAKSHIVTGETPLVRKTERKTCTAGISAVTSNRCGRRQAYCYVGGKWWAVLYERQNQNLRT